MSLAPQLSADHFIPTTPAPVAVPAPRPVQHRPGSILENKDNGNTVLSSFLCNNAIFISKLFHESTFPRLQPDY